MIATSLRFFYAIGVVFEQVSPPSMYTTQSHRTTFAKKTTYLHSTT